MAPSQGFPARVRLKSTAEFQRVYLLRNSSADDRLIVYAARNDLPYARLGLSVSRKHGGAVVRNRYKRLLREVFRRNQEQIPAGVDYVIVPRVRADAPTFDLLQASFLALSGKVAARCPASEVPADAPQGSGDTR